MWTCEHCHEQAETQQADELVRRMVDGVIEFCRQEVCACGGEMILEAK